MTVDLLQRYLAEIARNLPLGPEREDIVAEISDDIQSRVESGEGSEYDVIKAYGWPRYVAARYKSNQYLVGPTLYPLYLYVMKFAVTVVIGAAIFFSAFGALVTKKPDWFAEGLGVAWQSFFWVVGVVTVLFAVIERFVKNPIVPFDPAALPATGVSQPRPASAFEFIANFCMVLVLLFGGALVARSISPFAFTSAWQPAWYATLAGSAIIAGAAFATYLVPTWTKLRHVAQVGADVIMLVGASVMLRSGGPFITQNTQVIPLVDLGVVNMMVAWGCIVVILTLAIAGAVSLWKLLPHTTIR